MNIDTVERLDSKVFITIVQDFKQLKLIQFFSNFCTLQQLERKDALIVYPPNKQSEMEAKNLSQNQGDTGLFMK